MSDRILRVVVLVVGAIVPLHVAPVAVDAASVPTITAITAGGDHTCALTTGGGVKCWGENGYGQLGDGTTTTSNIPIDVAGLTSGVSAIAAGGEHTCALTSGGGVKCWGANDAGQLGIATTTDRAGLLAASCGIEDPSTGFGRRICSRTPVDVSGLGSGVTAIAAGHDQTCAVTGRGRVKCWGGNDHVYVDVGGGTSVATSESLAPVDVPGLASGVSAIAADLEQTCALTSGGGVKCWGDSATLVDVPGLTNGAIAIAAGTGYTCAITSGGRVKCWGGSATEDGVSVDVPGLTNRVIAIGPGGSHTCAVTSGGGVECWGSNERGQLGNGTTTDSSVPVGVSGITSGASAIAADYNHTCALMSSGAVKCWGAGYLGNGTTTSSLVPVDVDFTGQGTPRTDSADRRLRDRPAELPLLPLLAGVSAGIAMLVRRRLHAQEPSEPT